jgi:hypothetical protein
MESKNLLKIISPLSVAMNYMRLLAKGENTDSILDLCSVPLSWDKMEIISEQTALKQSRDSNSGPSRLKVGMLYQLSYDNNSIFYSWQLNHQYIFWISSSLAAILFFSQLPAYQTLLCIEASMELQYL